jgi:N-methylhydantoinase A
MREIVTIGAGGGTQAWYDKVSHTLRVGPQSSGADPGPVCYDAGGTEPTVTDADVVMQRIDPDSFLGGTRKLNREKAISSIKKKIAAPLNMNIYDAAEGICKIIDGKMQAALETVLANKGIDPKDYVLFAFGGAGPVHCAAYSAGLGFPKVIIVPNAAVFSAFGASTEDVRHRYEASPFIRWPDLAYDVLTSRFNKLTSLDQIPSNTIARFNNILNQLEKEAFDDMQAEEFQKSEVETIYEMSARYGGQLWELRCIVPVGRITSVDDLNAIIGKFEDDYHNEYGRIAMVPAGGLEIISLAIVCSAPTPKPIIDRKPFVGPDSAKAQKSEREVYFDGKWIKTKIYDMAGLQVGNIIHGPAIIEAEDTTLVVPTDRIVTVDEYENMIMEEKKN